MRDLELKGVKAILETMLVRFSSCVPPLLVILLLGQITLSVMEGTGA
jgi:hypothetical protein